MNEKLLAIRMLHTNEKINVLMEGSAGDTLGYTATIAAVIQRAGFMVPSEEYRDFKELFERFMQNGTPMEVQAERGENP